MKREEIKLNEFQLSVLLSDEEKNDYRYLLNNGVYCNGCQSICQKGVEIKSVKLNFLNRKKIPGMNSSILVLCYLCG